MSRCCGGFSASAVMYLGKIVEIADAEDLYTRPQHPYTGALLSAVPVADPTRARRRGRFLTGDEVPSASDPPPACRFHTRCPKCQDVCTQREPRLERHDGVTLAACHFPLTPEEVAEPLGERDGAVEARTGA